LALEGFGVWAGPRRLGWVRVWILLLALLGITMALGNQNELYRLVAGTVDAVRQFRVPARYLLLVCLPMAAAAGLGVDLLLYQEVGRPRRRVLQGWADWWWSAWCWAPRCCWAGTAKRRPAASGGCWPRRPGR
jgi:hypothetical protein